MLKNNKMINKIKNPEIQSKYTNFTQNLGSINAIPLDK